MPGGRPWAWCPSFRSDHAAVDEEDDDAAQKRTLRNRSPTPFHAEGLRGIRCSCAGSCSGASFPTAR